MNKSKFNNLQEKDTVTLAVDLEAYDSSGHHWSEHDKFIIPKGTEGILGAVKVPAVYGKKGQYFVCVDVPAVSIEYYQKLTKNTYVDQNGYIRNVETNICIPKTIRCAAFPADLV